MSDRSTSGHGFHRRTFLHNILAEFVSRREPFVAIRTWKHALLSQAEAAVEGDPEHYLGVSEVLLIVPYFPYRHVGFYYESVTLITIILLTAVLTIYNGQDIVLIVG